MFCHFRGVYDIFVAKDGVSVCVGKYNNKGSFGELALMYNTPRAATIVATEEGTLWGLVSELHCCFVFAFLVSFCKFKPTRRSFCVLSGSSHISPTDCEKQRKEEEAV